MRASRRDPDLSCGEGEFVMWFSACLTAGIIIGAAVYRALTGA